MEIIIKEKYGTVPASVLNSPLLSFKAKGLFAYIQAKPDGWDFSAVRICDETKESRESITNGIKELENVGLLRREKQSSGRTNYVLSSLFSPVSENPTEAFTHNGKNPQRENPTHNNTIVKENYSNKKTIIQTDILTEEIYFKYMENMPMDKRKYAKKAQTLLYLSSLLKTYDNAFLLSCIDNYKKSVEAKWWKAPQYFFSNSKSSHAKEYMFFLDYSTKGEKQEHITEEEKKAKAEEAILFFK